SKELVYAFQNRKQTGILISAKRSGFTFDQVPSVFNSGLILIPDEEEVNSEKLTYTLHKFLIDWFHNGDGTPVQKEFSKDEIESIEIPDIRRT
ncbi:MAG: hypothetical protein ABEK50_00315, partial [bacterium]